MAQVGKTIVHPLSGERLTFLETAATTGGDLLKISIEMAPGGVLGRPHVHPRAEEEFEVLSGRIQLKSSGTTRVAEAGESVIRRDIEVNIKERIYQAAFVVLIAFFAFIIFNDVSRLPMFLHIKQ